MPKGTSRDEVTLNSEKIKPIALAIAICETAAATEPLQVPDELEMTGSQYSQPMDIDDNGQE